MNKLLTILLWTTSLACLAQECPDNINIKSPLGGVGGYVQATSTGTCLEYTIQAIAYENYEFVCWGDDNKSISRTITISATSDTEMRAVFGKIADLHPSGGTIAVSVNDLSSLTYDVTASPTVACDTVKWSNSTVGQTTTYTEGDGDLTATFVTEEKQAYKVADASPVGGTIQVTIEECGFTLLAAPATADGYHFAYWEDQSTNPSRHVDNSTHVSYTAYFAQGTAMKDQTVFATVQDAIDDNTNVPVNIIDDIAEDISISKAVTINGANHTIGNVIITNSGNLTVGSALNANNLYLNSKPGASSQLQNPANLHFDNAYIDIQLESELSAAASTDKYYAIGVPFAVNVPAKKAFSTDITRANAPTEATTNYGDYVLWEYDGALRAENKENGWVVVAAGTMQPGKFYMFGAETPDNVWRFAKSNSDPITTTNQLSVSEYPSAGYGHNGWNALTNPQLVYSRVSVPNVEYAQVFNTTSSSGAYLPALLEGSSFVVASPFFVQAKANGNATFTKNSDGTLLAPTRATDDSKVLCQIDLNQNGKMLDRLFLTARDEGKNEYDTGKDLIKMMGGTADSYVWANDYGYRLCAHDLPWTNGKAEFSLTLFASAAGEYTLSANVGELYRNGTYLANLALGEYALNLTKGNNTGYTLRLGERNISTGISPSSLDKNQDETCKFIYNGRLYIRKDGRIFNAHGGEVR